MTALQPHGPSSTRCLAVLSLEPQDFLLRGVFKNAAADARGSVMSMFFHPIGCAGSCEPVRYMHFSFLAVVGETATTKFHRTILAGWQALMCDSSLFSKVTMHWWVQLGLFSLINQLEHQGTDMSWYVCWDQLEPAGTTEQILTEPQQGFESWEGYFDYVEESFKTFGDRVPRNLGNLGCLADRFRDLDIRIDSQKACASLPWFQSNVVRNVHALSLIRSRRHDSMRWHWDDFLLGSLCSKCTSFLLAIRVLPRLLLGELGKPQPGSQT